MDKIKFSIDSIQDITTESSDEFAIARISALSTKPNSHHILITDEILRRDGASILGKWVVCDFNGFDATTHTQKEHIIGIIPKDSQIEFVEEDGYTTMYVEAIISKLYATDVYKMFKRDNFRNVSVEMLTHNDFELPNGDIEIDGLKIVGVTVLGKTVNGSCPNANMEIVQFSADKAEKYYEKNFAKNEAIKLANALMEFANNISEREFAQNEHSLNKDSQDKEDVMIEEKKLPKSAENDKEKDIIMEEVVEEKELAEDSNVEMSENNQESDAEATEEKDMAETNNEDATKAEEKEMACTDTEMTECGQDKEMSEDTTDMACGDKDMACGDKEMSEDETDKEEDKEETMSEKASVFAEDVEDKQFIEKLFSCELNEMVSTIIELKKFKDERIAKDTLEKFNCIMANVKGDLDEKQFAELSQEGATLSLDELDAFNNKVKAFAYEATKNNVSKVGETEDILQFADMNNVNQEAEMSADDIYKKYL